jgi:cytochrome c-type biogenesis protein CcmH
MANPSMPAGGAVSRRWFLRAAGLAALVPAARAVAQQPSQQPGQEPLAGEGDNGTLRDPSVVGRSRERTSAKDNDEAIKQIELQLHCTCGCSLDIYTCRTTDFTCTYSPELHKEVVALYDDGKTAEQILDAFVAKYGEKVLMAPKPEGFNRFGYMVPGAAIASAGAALVMLIGRRKHAVATAAANAGGAGASAPSSAGSASDPAGSAATPEELERLRRALREVED